MEALQRERERETERETANTQAFLSYDILSEINAGNFLARRSLEAMQATEGMRDTE